MPRGCSQGGYDLQVSEADARRELERLLADPEFRCTDRNKNFLRFIAEELFQGRGGAVKAYTIAVDVFGRPSSFDPATDPIVRIEATRLRAALERYYERLGDSRRPHIELPKGRYVPVFCAPDEEALGYGGGAASEVPEVTPRPNTCPERLAGLLGILGTVLVATYGAMQFGIAPPAPVVSDKPIVTVKLTADDGADRGEGALVETGLLTRLARLQSVRADSTTTGRAVSAEPLRQSSYRVLVRYKADAMRPSASWQVTDGETGQAVGSGTEEGTAGPVGADDLSSRLARRLGGTRGLINSIETMKEMADPSLGYGCVLRANVALQAPDDTALARVRLCLERTVSGNPGNADAFAALALVLLALEPIGSQGEFSRRALTLADMAVLLAPFSDRSKIAQMKARFRAGQVDAALAAGHEAMRLNPDDSAAPAFVGGMMAVTGRWNEGLALIRKSRLIDDAHNCEADFVMALDAYRRGHYEDALSWLDHIGGGEPLVQSVRIAVLGRLGRIPDAQAAYAEIARPPRAVAEAVRRALSSIDADPSLIVSIEKGLAMASAHQEAAR